MLPSTVEAILVRIGKRWTLAKDAEITLEANPTSVEASRFKSFRAAGVNRVSLGVQALNDIDLKALGRQHTVAEALAALNVANRIFERSSFDLIYARPGQTAASWKKELEIALAYAGEHLSLYQLTIEPDTMFERMAEARQATLPDTDAQRALWDVTQELTIRAGLPAYEVSNHARPGARVPAQSHLLALWRICRRRSRRAWPNRSRRAVAAPRRPSAIRRCG